MVAVALITEQLSAGPMTVSHSLDAATVTTLVPGQTLRIPAQQTTSFTNGFTLALSLRMSHTNASSRTLPVLSWGTAPALPTSDRAAVISEQHLWL